MHGIDENLESKELPNSHLVPPSLRSSDRHHYLRKKIAESTQVLLLWIEFAICSVLIKVLKHF